MSNTHQFKPGDRVKVGPPVYDDIVDSQRYAKEGAYGVILTADNPECEVAFYVASPTLPCGLGPWWIDNRRLTLVDEKPVEPAAPLPNDGGPAFPCPETGVDYRDNDGKLAGCRVYSASIGMTLRQYAAIKLCVPDSGTPWLDEMIKQSLKDRFAGQALAGILAHPQSNELGIEGCIESAADAATAMMERRGK